MQNTKLIAGQRFPNIEVKTPSGKKVNMVQAAHTKDAKDRLTLIIIYRGYHCPICLSYLNELTEFTERLDSLNVGVVAVSADSSEQLDKMKEKGLDVNYPVLTELQISDMKTLGLYISDPRSPSETDHAFAEPGLYIVNAKGETIMIDVSNAPFIRPNLKQLVDGLEFVLENNYPIRGTHAY